MTEPASGARQYPLIRIAGDSALLVEFGEGLDLAINNAVQLFDAVLSAAQVPGVRECTPTLRSVLIRYDPLTIALSDLQQHLRSLLDTQDWCASGLSANRKRWHIPVCYGAEYGPDLEEVAQLLKVPPADLIRMHCAAVQRVLTLGFAPGFCYLGLLPPNWDLPRLNYVKPEVPAGSLSVAVRQTVMTSTPIPTGWRTIGRTPFSNFNLNLEPPFAIGPGDEIACYPIDGDQFAQLQRRVDAGQSIVEAQACQ